MREGQRPLVTQEEKKRTAGAQSLLRIAKQYPTAQATAFARPSAIFGISRIRSSFCSEQRSNLKFDDDKGVVDCGHGVYTRAKAALAAQTASNPPER
jgi:hypothetical protein